MAEAIPNEAMLTSIAKRALRQWDLDVASVEPYSHRENTVFQVIARDGRAYALRVHRPGYHDLRALESEHVWTAAMQAAGLAVPDAVDTRDGHAYATVAVPGSDETRHVGLVKWINGVTLEAHLGEDADDSAVSSTYRSLGRLIAEFHLATAEWSPPAGFKRHAWDAQGFVGKAPFWGRFWELDAATPAQAAQLRKIRERLLKILSALPKDAGVYGMIHADLNANNVLQDGEALTVIDFDDAGFGWHAFDLAVAIWSGVDALRGKTHFELARDALFEGYRQRRPGCAQLETLVPMFLLVRSLMVMRWMQDRPEGGYAQIIPSLLTLALTEARALDWSELEQLEQTQE